ARRPCPRPGSVSLSTTMADTSSLRDIAHRVSNWGGWGADYERGTMIFITPDVIRRAVATVRRGVVFSLALPLDGDGPQFGQGGRVNPVHLMTSLPNTMREYPDGP